MSSHRGGRVQIVSFVLLGIAYVALYAIALVITAVASLGGGGKNLELLVDLGYLAGLVGAVVGALSVWLSRRWSPRASWLGVSVAWVAWVIVAGLSPMIADELDKAASWLAFAPPVLTFVSSVAGVIAAVRAVRPHKLPVIDGPSGRA
jgi:hypothetical protein